MSQQFLSFFPNSFLILPSSLPNVSQYFLSFLPISSLILPSNPPYLSQYFLSFLPISSPILSCNPPYLSQRFLPFLPIPSPILPMNFTYPSLPSISIILRSIILFAAVPLSEPSQSVALGFPFAPSPIPRSTSPPPSCPAASLPLSFSGSSHIYLLSPSNLLNPFININI